MAEAHFFDLPAAVGEPARGAADYQQYTLTIADGERRHTVRVLVPPQDQALGELLQAVQKQVEGGPAAVILNSRRAEVRKAHFEGRRLRHFRAKTGLKVKEKISSIIL